MAACTPHIRGTKSYHIPEVLGSKDTPLESPVPSGNNVQVTVVSVPSGNEDVVRLSEAHPGNSCFLGHPWLPVAHQVGKGAVQTQYVSTRNTAQFCGSWGGVGVV